MVFLVDNDLYFNVENNYLDKVNELLDDPKRYFQTGACYGSKRQPLLSVAVETGNAEIVAVLCSYGFSVGDFDALGMTPLHLAVSLGNAVMVKTLLLHGAKADSLCSLSYSSPLHLAAEQMTGLGEDAEGNSSQDLLGLLLHSSKSPVNVNVRDLHGQTPLMRAATFGHADKVRLLMEKGANPRLSSKTGETAFSLLCQFPAVSPDHIRIFLHGLKHEIRSRILNEMSGLGDLPLHMLIRNRSKHKIQAMKALLQYGASIDLKNWSGYTPLALACILKDVNAARILLVSGSSLHEEDASQRTPLDIVLENRHHELLGLLARAGASLNFLPDNASTWNHLPEGTKEWIQGRSKVLRPLTYWARLSLIDYNRRSLKKTFPDTLCLPQTLNNYLNYLEEDDFIEVPPPSPPSMVS